MVTSYSVLIYVCTCDNCNKVQRVEKNFNKNIYNRAQAVRSLGWSFSKDGKRITCDNCRKHNWKDSYRYV